MSQKAIFLDRDDTLIDDPGYLKDPAQIKLLPGATDAIIHLRKMGYLVLIITNQSAVARGYITEKQLDQIHQKLKSLLSAEGAAIDGIYYCPYHPDGTVPGFNTESHLRKPNPGMLQKAAEEMGIDLERSWMVGDTHRDIQAGKAAGCHTILVDVPGKTRELDPAAPQPDRKAVNLREVVNIIRMHEFHLKAQAAKKNLAKTAQHPESEKDIASVSYSNTIKSDAAEEAEDEAQKKTMLTPEKITETLIENLPQPSTPEVISEKPPIQIHSTKPLQKNESVQPNEHVDKTHHMLQEVLHHLTSLKRSELYEDFSAFKLLAGMAQVIALFCLVFSLWFWLSPKIGYDAVQIMIGYAIALQLLVIALVMMHKRN
ncbi:MAG: HAD family hydrolase [Planctomycetes bacterium]|nr:HAD family hydrolase [Planctomycetota bacterium]